MTRYPRKPRISRQSVQRRDYNAISPLWNTIFNIVIGIFSFSCIFPFLFVIIISLTDEQTLVLEGFRRESVQYGGVRIYF